MNRANTGGTLKFKTQLLPKRKDGRRPSQLRGGTWNINKMVGGMSELLRRLQTGSVRAYAASVFVGVVCILGYYLWR